MNFSFLAQWGPRQWIGLAAEILLFAALVRFLLYLAGDETDAPSDAPSDALGR